MRKKCSSISVTVLFSFILAPLFLSGCKDILKTEDEKLKSITFISLLDEMTDRNALTRFPAFSLRQVSTWDRTQTDPADVETWFNNKDYGYYIRKEENEGRTEYVIMEELNPGCIVRWWIPLENIYKDRILRIYLDGQKTPVIEENYHEFISGKSFIKPPFAFISSDEEESAYQLGLPVGHPKQMGADIYFPIPFAKSCKITLDDNPFYYVINYRVYNQGIKVKSFTMEEFYAAGKIIEEAANELKSNNTRSSLKNKDRILYPGKEWVIDLPEGSNAVNSIFLKPDTGITKELMRGIVIQAEFDGKETIWCPISEFFGAGVYLNPVANRNCWVTKNGLLVSRWIMPYRLSGKIKITNYAAVPLKLEFKVQTEKYEWKSNSLYFHANWREEAPINTGSPIDWNYLKVEGMGVYAGDVLTVHSFSKGWWGEGDEKIYIDGEKFPSMLGTGLEDYYGFAWGMAHHFSSPFISNALRDAKGKGDWRGYTTVARMRLLDGIPFKENLKVDVEAWLRDSSVSYSVASFFYGSFDATSNAEKDTLTIQRQLPAFTNDSPVLWPGEKFPDPAENGLVTPPGNGFVRHAGNHIDFLNWQDHEKEMPMDIDKDSKYGSDGYYLFASRTFDGRNIKFTDHDMINLPGFVESVEITGEQHFLLQNAWLTTPAKPSFYIITGTLKGQDPGEGIELVKFKLINDVPEVFRLGIMTDNSDHFLASGQKIMVSSSASAQSGQVPLARSNRYPDWYFFDIRNAVPGDIISIFIFRGQETDKVSLGGISFDFK